MSLISRRKVLGAALTGVATSPWAQDYPNRVVRLIVPFPAGGVVDIAGRLLAEELTRQLGANVIVENKVGAGGTIGATEAARAPADGYTILLGGAATHAFAPYVYKQLRYDPVKDFAPVTLFTEGPLALCVNATSAITNMKEFMQTVQRNGDAMNYASNGNGTFPHLSVELMNQILGVKPQHIPFPGGPQAITALIGRQVQFTQNHIPVVQAHVKSGRLRVVATTGATRSQAFPDVPTLKESGIDVVASAWFGLFMPAGAPPAVVERIHQATLAASKSQILRDKLAAQGDEVKVEGPARFQAFHAAELEKWRRVINTAGLKLD